MSGWTPGRHPLPAQLSGGEQQRVGVARALAADPPVLVGGQAFSAVDPVIRHELQRTKYFVCKRVAQDHCLRDARHRRGVELADLVAVFARAARLHYYDETARLLSSPANDFVSKFAVSVAAIGGWLFDAAGLPVRDVRQVSVNGLSAGTGKFVTAGCWWSTVRTVELDRRRWPAAYAAAAYRMPTVGGSVFANGNLSQADAALSRRRGQYIVDGSGKVIGRMQRRRAGRVPKARRPAAG